MESLENIRKNINEIDSKMMELFEKRMDCAEKVIAYKIAHNLPVFDAAREKEIIANSITMLKNKAYESYYTEFITCLMDLSKKYQSRISNHNTIGYQGTEGAFSHIASKTLFPHADLKSYANFEEVFIAVENGDIASGVLPFENSFTGGVAEVVDLLMKYNCYISQMYNLKVSHNLVGHENASIKEIREVYSHHQAISQCQQYLKSFDFTVIPYANTALAAKYVRESGDPRKAAIASKETAEIYNLKILAENINTSTENTTKFIVISKAMSDEGDKFSLLFTVKHDAGQLAKIIQIIASHNFNMESLHSRPLKDVPWQYYFYAEIAGKLNDERTQKLLEEMAANCTGLKVLGSYKAT